MNREEYFQHIETSIKQTLEVSKFDNYKKQMFAWRIGARFNRSYEEDYLWRRALYLSTNSCRLLKYNTLNKTAIKALKTSAEIYEYLSEISEEFDRDYCYILSALCYDISGYQANALCMMQILLKENNKLYAVDSGDREINTNLNDENYILYHIQQILLKHIPTVFFSKKRSSYGIESNLCEDYLGVFLFDKAVYGLYEHILKGYDSSFSTDIYEAYKYYLLKGNVFISHLLHLLSCRFGKYQERSIWNVINPENQSNSIIWTKYIRLLTNDLYTKFHIKKPKNRKSIFEFWISQLRAVEQGVLKSDDSFVIQMPTSAGKTFIAEIAILEGLIKFPTKKCIYIAPFRALTNEKESELSKNLSKLGYTVSSLSGAYEVDEFQNFILETTDVLIATPEKLDLLYRMQIDYFKEVSLLVVDEGHIIGGSNERAALLEFLIIRLKIKVKKLKILFISAVMPAINGKEFSLWVSNKDNNIIESPIYIDDTVWQPTRKLVGKFKWVNKTTSQITYPEENLAENKNRARVIPFITNLIQRKKIGNRLYPQNIKHKGQTAVALAYELSKSGSTLIFCPKPNLVIKIADAFLTLKESFDKEGTPPLSYFIENKSSVSYYTAVKWLGKKSTVARCIKFGVGVHYGDLPRPVRKAVENDYRNGSLRILISTNTIGQGLNFPIKNLIIHSLDIDARIDLKIKVGEFWNIIGRAGRAGKETEGQIIFLVLSSTDEEKFTTYTNKNNIERIYSIFSLMIRLRLKSTTYSKSDFISDLEELSEPFILSLLTEEMVESEDEKLIERIIDNSLFKIQVADISPIRKGFKKIVKNIRQSIPEQQRLDAFATNGFNLKSNCSLEIYIENNIENLKIIIEKDDHQTLLLEILKSLDDMDINEVQFDEKLEKLNGVISSIYEFLIAWIEGVDINILYNLWKKTVHKDLESKAKMFVFLSQGITFKIPWGITAFMTILVFKLQMKLEDLPSNIQSLSSYVKCGLNDKIACLALSLGLKSRELSKFVSNKNPFSDSHQSFVTWLSNLTISEINSWKINNVEKEDVIDLALKFNTKKFKTKIPKELSFWIKGTFFLTSSRANSLKAKVGDLISYERDIDNQFDPFAIKLFLDGNGFLGFIPRELAKPLSIEIDLNEKKYAITIIKVVENGSLNNIKVALITIS